MRARAPLVHDSMGGFKVWYHVVGSLMSCSRKASHSLATHGVTGLAHALPKFSQGRFQVAQGALGLVTGCARVSD